MVMIYDGFRKDGGPTLYESNKTPVTKDVLEIGFIYAAVILVFSLLIVLPGIRGIEKVFVGIRIVVGVFVIAVIMLVNFGQEWEVAHGEVTTQYRAGLTRDIEASIGVKIGLRSVNVTLKGKPEVQQFENGLVNETVNYNERFHWNNEGFTQGRIGFGPYAGTINQEFRAAQYKGLPYPILWIVEYFTIDGEGIRWGRHYRQAGYYTHVMIWTAFPMWIISIILLHTVVRYGAYFTMMTGGCLLIANILYGTIRNPFDLVIPFEGDHLTFTWGWCFYLCLITGILCVLMGLVVFIMDLRWPETIATFFGADVLQDLEEYYADPTEMTVHWKKQSVMPPPPSPSPQDYEDVSQPNGMQDDTAANVERRYRRRTETSLVRRLQRTQKRRPRPPPREPRPDAGELYENVDKAPTVPPKAATRVKYAADNQGFSDGDVHLEVN